MYKRSISIVMLLYYIAMQTADLDMYAKIKNHVIEGSTHYRLVPGTKNTVQLNHNAPFMEVVEKPYAIFYGYNREKHKKKILGIVTVDNIDRPTIKRLNQLIDRNVSLPTIKTAVIYPCSTRGRIVRFYDQQGNRIDYTMLHYIGSRNIKFAERDIRLIKPHKLLHQLEEVREYVPQSSRTGSGYRKYCVKYDTID